jgi:GNAT superfamily N-acetyltransferase
MEPQPSTVTIKTAQSEPEIERVYAFAISVLGAMEDTVHTLDYYREQCRKTPTLLVYAERGGEIAGCSLGSLDGDHVLVGPTAVAQNARRLGIGAAMLRRLDQEALNLGQTTLILGSRLEAEAFYLSCGFHPNLFIQLPEAGRLEDLKQLNHCYFAVWEADEDGCTKLMLALPKIDRDLQASYEKAFSGCHTQTVMIKELAQAG